MADKKEGFGLPGGTSTAGNSPQPPNVYETPDYRVIVGRLSGDPEGGAPELLVRYIIQHKKHGVIYGTAAGVGQAIAAAVQAQVELQNASEGAKEFEARSFSTAKDDKGDGGPGIPNFGKTN